MNNGKLIALLAIGLVTIACSNKVPETKVEKKMVVNKETGELEEKDVYSTVIYSSKDKKMPKLDLPKKKK